MNRRPWPSRDECHRLLEDVGCHPRILEHVETVAEVADRLSQAIRDRGHAVDEQLVTAGALLHDIGRSRTQGFDHASVGAAILREQGYPEALCLIVERHTGAGIDPEEAKGLGLPVKDYTPRTLEEKLVCHADNLVDGSRRQKVQEELAHLRGLGLDRVAQKMATLHRELSLLARRDLDEIV